MRKDAFVSPESNGYDMKEVIATGKTVEAAIASGAEELHVDASCVTYEVLEQPKKGFLGFGETLAKVKVSYVASPEVTALRFVRKILEDMQLNATAELSRDGNAKRDRVISITGKDATVLIGYHGETMEAFQYLVNLAANRRDEEDEQSFARISINIENYRAKREETLRKLARRMADKVQRSRKSIALEPMNPYERRIIHSEIQNIRGVTTKSTGTDHNRRVVIYPEGAVTNDDSAS